MIEQLKNKKILLGISGSIAAYKAPELVRLLQKNGAEVTVMMTQSAQKFVSVLVMEALTGKPVLKDLFEEGFKSHIHPIREADVLLIAPATANLVARLAYGLADDVVTAAALAAKIPVLIAPAMNTAMWKNPLVQENIQKLRKVYEVIDPAHGLLACGEEGDGRLANLEIIVDEVVRAVTPKDLQGRKVLITAGATREFLDPVRFMSNGSSGKMGLALAKEAYFRGAEVTVIAAKVEVDFPAYVNLVSVESAEQMLVAVEKEFGDKVKNADKNARGVGKNSETFLAKPDIFIAAAAVADYKFAEKFPKKMKKNAESVSLKMIPNPDILERVLAWRDLGLGKKIETGRNAKNLNSFFVIGFALETATSEQNLIKLAQQKFSRKKVDLLVVNSSKAIGADQAEFLFLTPPDAESSTVKKMGFSSKEDVSRNVFDYLVKSF